MDEAFSNEAHTPPALYRTSAESFSTDVEETGRLADGLAPLRGDFLEEAFGLFDNVGADGLKVLARDREEAVFLEDVVDADFLGFT